MLKNKTISLEIRDVLEGEDLLLDEVKDNSHYSNIRNQNKSEMLEDYVEAIQDILKNKGDVKNGDLAQHFGVSQATVNKNLKRLISFKLAKSEPYRSIFLTEKGEKLATKSKQKHEIVYNFLIKLGVSRKTAENDSEGIEHHVSEETLKLMKKFSE
jgi:DtxR family manganese transport transcriptional regulator